MTITEIAVLLLAVIGVAFMFISAIGILRFPDVFARMHAVGKASTLGISCVLLAAGIYYGGGYLVRMILLILFFFLTAPVATAAMARAAYRTDPIHKANLIHDDMADERYIHGAK